MTNADRTISLIGFAPANTDALPGALIDRGVDPEGTYDGSNKDLIKAAAIEVMELLLTTADTRNEGGYSITFDRKAVMERINQLKNELGLIDTSLPFVTSRTVW
jgi:hypothetical protein